MNEASTARVVVAVLLLIVACSGGSSEPARVESARLALEVRTVPERPRVGGNQLELLLRDAQGVPVDDAHVSARIHMHAMGAMPAMGGPASVEKTGDGRWRADFDLAMGGTWIVEIRAHRPDGTGVEAEGSLSVGTPGLRLEAIGAAAPEPPSATSAPGAAPETGRTPRSPAAAPGAFRFDESRLRQIGVHSELPRTEDLTRVVRALGRVVLDETTLHDVTIRVAGFVEQIDADALGEPVVAGQVLFRFYSPDAHAAQSEYLTVRRSQAAARGGTAPERSDGLVRAAAERLRLWGIDAADIAVLARRGTPQETLPVRAPISGYVVEKTIVAGSPVAVGQRAYRIAPLDRVWIEAEVYEAELPRLAVGQPAEVVLPYAADQRFPATIAYVYPDLDPERRTARVRLELANPDLALRPEMYADVFLRQPLGSRFTVPASALLRTGDRSFVFVDLGGGRLQPQQVVTGIESDGRVEILSGLAPEQRVVVSGTFLVASESRLRAALETWR
jgi:Cu(I)/Ag(I) efflux system membrane fusion protein